MPDRMKATRTEDGLGLLELLIATTLLVLVGLGVSSLVLSSVQLNQNGDFTSATTWLATTKLDELRQTDYAALVGGEFSDVATLQGRSFDRRWTIEADTPVEGVARIEVQVTARNEAKGPRRTSTVVGFRTSSTYAQGIRP